jgi:hypothetical protein
LHWFSKFASGLPLAGGMSFVSESGCCGLNGLALVVVPVVLVALGVVVAADVEAVVGTGEVIAGMDTD